MNPMELIAKLMDMGPEKAEAYLGTIAITSEGGLHGAITVTKNDEFDPARIDFVVCGFARPGAYRVDGAVDVKCDDCKKLVILSPSSPQNKPRLCYPCAKARVNGEQSVKE